MVICYHLPVPETSVSPVSRDGDIADLKIGICVPGYSIVHNTFDPEEGQ